MKVVCESCQAKYQVPDERVAGKKLKIRCKRCGATVLIRGDLAQAQSGHVEHGDHGDHGGNEVAPAVDSPSVSMALSPIAAAEEAPAIEWHVSLDGDSRGPFETEELKVWLAQQPGAWDAHVWREGFPDWIEARLCAELGPAPAGLHDHAQEDEAPTQTFDNAAVAPFMAAAGSRRSGGRSGESVRAASSSIRSRSASGIAMGVSPRVNAAEALTGERHEDSVLFSAQNLQTMTSSAPAYSPGPNPGFAGGDGSGLIDIRALASLARQTQARVAPHAGIPASQSGGYAAAESALSYGSEADEEARIALMNQSSAFGRVDSLAPVSSAARTSSVAVPLAILGGCALVAAAVFAAILIARPSKSSEPVAVAVPTVQEQDSLGATAQPVQTPEPQMAAPAAEEPPPAAADEPTAAADEPKTEGAGVIAAGKARRQPRGSRTSADEKKTGSPEEKTKPKKEEKSEPPSLDEVMLADQAKPAKPAPEPAKSEPAKGGTDIDTLLGAKPAKQPSKSRSIDDLLSGAVDKDGKAPAPAKAAPAAAPAEAAAGSDLPESPSRDETLAAMRGVEAAVRACAAGQSVTGTAEVQMSVAGATGHVTTANVTGITGAVGSCIARAVRNAKFPHFTKAAFAIKYPYRF